MRLPRDMAMPPVLAVGSRLTGDLGLAAAPSMRKGGRARYVAVPERPRLVCCGTNTRPPAAWQRSMRGYCYYS